MNTATQPAKSVTAYLAALTWDGKPRLDRWLIDCAGAEDTPYVRAAARAMLIAAVRRARQPGCRFDQMPVIQGPQGSCKSVALRVLAVEDAWFMDSLPRLDASAREILEATQGKWIVEASELADLIQRDVEAQETADDDVVPSERLKAFLSRTHDEGRMAYQRETSRVPRQFVVFGTTAAAPFLTEAGQHRRFWPIEVQKFDVDKLAAIRDQIWAEACAAEALGESIQLASDRSVQE